MSTPYSELPTSGPRPCRMCSADTAPGQPGHEGSQQYFDEDPCDLHFKRGFKEPGCIDCTVELWYICGTCTGAAGQQGEWVSVDEVLGGGAGESVH